MAVTAKSGFRVNKGKENAENPEVIEVSFGNLRDGSLVSLFVPHWEPSQSGTPQALVIEVDDKIRRAGNYDLILNLQPKSVPTAPRLKIQIVHAPSKLEVPEKLLVIRTLQWPMPTKTDKMNLDIREASGLSGVAELGVESRASMLGTELVTGQLNVDTEDVKTPKKAFLPAGEPRVLPYELSGDFPLGTVTGSVRFLAPELSDPVTLNFEVRSRLTKAYILLAIILGLLFSWLLKVHLQNRIQLAEARSKGSELLGRVQANRSSHRDSAFRGAIDPAISDLENALRENDAAKTTEKTKALDDAWHSALMSFSTRRQDAQSALDDLRKVTDTNWVVPPSVLETLAKAKQDPARNVDVQRIREQLAANDASKASQSTAELRRGLAQELRASAITWHSNIISYLKGLAGARAGLPRPVIAQLADVLAKNAQGLERMNPEQIQADPSSAALVQFLRDFEAEYRLTCEVLKEFQVRLAEEWTEFSKALDLSSEEVSQDRLLVRVKEMLDTIALEANRSISSPPLAEKALQQCLVDLQKAWREAFGAMITSIPAASRPDVDALLQKQDFVLGAEEVATARAKSGGRGALKLEAAQERTTLWPEFAGLWPPSSLSVVSTAPQISGTPQALEALHLASLGQIRSAKAIQTIIVAVLITVWAYVYYAKAFGGTWSDLGLIFFAAFGLDITVDALVSKIAGKSAAT